MTKIKFSGFPAGSVDVSVGSTNGTTTWPTETQPDEDTVFVVQPGEVIHENLAPFGINLEKDAWNNGEWPQGFTAPSWNDRWLALAGTSGNRIEGDVSKIFNFGSFARPALIGGEADVYRISNGVYSKVRTSEIVDAGGARWFNPLPGNTYFPGTTAGGTTTVGPINMNNWKREGQTYWFGVRAVNSITGDWGPITVASNTYTNNNPSNPGPSNVTGIAVEKQGGFTDEEDPTIETVTNVTVSQIGTGENAVEITFDELSTAPGVAVFVTDQDPALHEGGWIELANDGGSAVQEGDQIFTRKKANVYGRDWKHSRVWYNAAKFENPMFRGSNVYPDDDPSNVTWRFFDTPGEVYGDAYVHIELSAGSSVELGNNYAAGEGGNDFYDIIEQNRVVEWSFWGRSTTTDATVELLHGVSENVEVWDGSAWVAANGRTFTLTTSWAQYKMRYRRIGDDNASGVSRLEMTITAGASAADIDLAGLRIFYEDSTYGQFLPEVEAKLSSPIDHLRQHTYSKSLEGGYTIDDLTNRAGEAEFRWDNIGTLPALFEQCERLGARPWILPDLFFPPEWFEALIEYIAAPYDPATDTPAAKPWAHKRYQQGRTAPWSDAFDRIYFELGLEVWNNRFSPNATEPMTDSVTGEEYGAGAVYALMTEHMISTMQASPYWSSLANKAKFVLGIQASTQAFGNGAVSVPTSANYFTAAIYIQGWETGDSFLDRSPGSSREALFYAENDISEWYQRDKELIESAGLEFGLYESGPGYAFVEMTEAQQLDEQRSGKSKPMGQGILDGFLTMAELGGTLISYYTLQRGEDWASHGTRRNGYSTFPAWKFPNFWNTVGAEKKMVRVVPGRESLEGDDVENVRANSVKVYSTVTDAGDLVLAVFNRNIPYDAIDSGDALYRADDDGSRTVRIQVRKSESDRSGTLYTFDGDWRSHTWDIGDADFLDHSLVETSATLPANGEFSITIPAAEFRIYHFPAP